MNAEFRAIFYRANQGDPEKTVIAIDWKNKYVASLHNCYRNPAKYEGS